LQLLDIKMNGFDLIQIIIFLKLKLYSRAGILITTRCSAGCRFCIYGNLEKKDAEKIVKKAIKDAEIEKQKILQEANNKVKKHLNLTQKKSEETTKKILEDAQKQISELKKNTDKKISNAADLIVKEIGKGE